MKCIIMAAIAENGVIGNQNKIPWHIPEDFALFKSYTKGNVVIMGRKTFESLGGKPLPHRVNIVVGTKVAPLEGIVACATLADALRKAKTYGKDVYICGGSRIYEESLPFADKLYISHVKGVFKGDTFFPRIAPEWKIESTKEYEKFTFTVYVR